jgi:hypothetical protein
MDERELAAMYELTIRPLTTDHLQLFFAKRLEQEMGKTLLPFPVYVAAPFHAQMIDTETAFSLLEMSETANRNLPASARSKMAVSEHDQELHASVAYSPAVLDTSINRPRYEYLLSLTAYHIICLKPPTSLLLH